MSKKRQTRNSKKFKKAAASKRARAPMQKGGQMFAGGTSGFDPRTGTVKRAPIKGGRPRVPEGITMRTQPVTPTLSGPMPPPQRINVPTIPQSQMGDILSRGTVGQTTGINPNPMAGIPAGTAGVKPLPPPGKRDPSEGTPSPAPTSTGVSERPDNTEGQLPEFTGTVPNTTATGRVFQPDTTTRRPTDDAGQLPPSDDDGQAKRPTNVAEARAQQQAADETFPDRADYTTDDEYQAAVQEYVAANRP